VYLMDKQHNLYAYSLLVSVLAYQTAIVRRDFDEGSHLIAPVSCSLVRCMFLFTFAAKKALNEIPPDHHNRIARFLEACVIFFAGSQHSRALRLVGPVAVKI
jgi:hypothetical protein